MSEVIAFIAGILFTGIVAWLWWKSWFQRIWWAVMLWPYRLIVMPVRFRDFRWWHLSYHREVRESNRRFAENNDRNWT